MRSRRCVGLASLSASQSQHRSMVRVPFMVIRGCVGVLTKVGRGFQQRMAGLGGRWGVIVFRQWTSARTGAMAPFPIHEDYLRHDTHLFMRYDTTRITRISEKEKEKEEKKHNICGDHHRTRGKHRHMDIWDIPAKDLGRED